MYLFFDKWKIFQETGCMTFHSPCTCRNGGHHRLWKRYILLGFIKKGMKQQDFFYA